ncbi:hypothetical protein HTZ77_24320 [Nonomuraea sp. SMC257]|uniref:Aminoglycoside phosphotransferase family protein n=1 Tax=Nonomuraea montanisoli TaxID=2741721 RepID=A0A7Y6IBP1_9ACTN|nr:hypothetical protein [Nonomuraea montanisoli]NUW34540.1 hypothetical protein [Nonomuraea montanisoli]
MARFCRRAVGDHVIMADRSWPHAESIVLHIRDRHGKDWIAKHCRREEHFAQELVAYREWVPALGGLAPTLLGQDERHRTLLLTFEPGEVETYDGAGTYRQAGALIRRFHDAADQRAGDDFVALLAARLDRALSRGREIFSRRDADFLREQLKRLNCLPEPMRVPVHADNQPRNWLVDTSGTVRLIDFGLSRWDVWIRDLVRLYYRDWRREPELQDAFLDGYGRRLHAADLELLQVLGAITAVTTVLWARERGDAGFESQGWNTLALVRTEAG